MAKNPNIKSEAFLLYHSGAALNDKDVKAISKEFAKAGIELSSKDKAGYKGKPIVMASSGLYDVVLYLKDNILPDLISAGVIAGIAAIWKAIKNKKGKVFTSQGFKEEKVELKAEIRLSEDVNVHLNFKGINSEKELSKSLKQLTRLIKEIEKSNLHPMLHNYYYDSATDRWGFRKTYEISNKNKIQDGYKKSPLGIIPKDWNYDKLPTVTWFQEGPGLRHWQFTDSGMKVINITNLENGKLNLSKTDRHISIEEFRQTYKHFAIDEGDIVMASSGATYCKTAIVYKSNLPLVMNTSVIRFKPLDNFNYSFLYSFLSSELLKKQIDILITGGAQPNFGPVHLKQCYTPIPPIPEQQIIANCLSIWDKAIELHTLLIVQKELRRKRLMQLLLSGEKRIKKYSSGKFKKSSLGKIPMEWEPKSISTIVNPIKKSFTPEPHVLYQQVGIRSHTKGLFYKERVTGASLGNKSVFWIEPNCFIVNIVFAWEHAIAKTTKNEIGMIASHRFPMYKPKANVLDLDYLLYYFKSPKGKYLLGLASPGGAGRNKTLGQSEFLKLKIPVPPIQEQTAIVSVLNKADAELVLLKRKLKCLKEQKKGLMQILLTGKKRLKIKK